MKGYGFRVMVYQGWGSWGHWGDFRTFPQAMKSCTVPCRVFYCGSVVYDTTEPE
jgi:hypothetical protein